MSVADEVENLVSQVKINTAEYRFTPEPRCRVCAHPDDLLGPVNRLLVAGLSYRQILDAIIPIMAELPEGERPTINSIYNHARRHFAVDQAAKAAFRQTLEQRAIEAQVDFVEGATAAVTPLAYLDVVMQAAFQKLTERPHDVSIEQGLKAAEKLATLTKKEEGAESTAELKEKMNRVIAVVKEAVPKEFWPLIVEGLDALD